VSDDEDIELCDLSAVEGAKMLDRLEEESGAPSYMRGDELSSLAKRLVEEKDPAELARIREALTRGFYGKRQE
jgi:hypothetical protein